MAFSKYNRGRPFMVIMQHATPTKGFTDKWDINETIMMTDRVNDKHLCEAVVIVDILQQKITSAYSKVGKQEDELEIIDSQLGDIESGLVSSIVPPRQKDIKQRLVKAGIKTEFLADCLEIKKGAESFREQIENLIDPFKFHLVIQKKDLQNVIEILKDDIEISIIVPDDWPPNNYAGQSIGDYLVIKDCAPEKLQNFINYFALNNYKGYGPNENVFLDEWDSNCDFD